ncbi:hypothetical protein OO007_14150 [Cocleimonas sp. KMM 6892]|nr:MULTISPECIES: hypothetical protein [unclassified Cocleimonas]MEB8433378.1 hypothetical protein [Cocleimonas sp. KMM 6892]MEC4716189.1 hypothetical protein [Cocleimonas sp. KMM 6895]MEC4745918.1 hypothetical protein [Cocleimonas sp. KMM 6896]
MTFYKGSFVDSPANGPSAQRHGSRRLRETWKVIDDEKGDINGC